MERRCKHPDCYVPQTSCVMGNRDASSCEFWVGGKDGNSDDPPPATEPTTDTTMVPWSGLSMGLSDLGFLAARGAPGVVGVIGAHDAGKTTFLAALFLLMLRHGCTPQNSFAGSWTLSGWEQLASHLKWSGSEPPRFPPHTTAFEKRTPGLLHLAFRRDSGALRDLLFVDAPGEWYRQWAFDREASGADGARWVAAHADLFLVFVDCAALAGDSRGEARVITRQILQRVVAERQSRPLILVWSKCDVQIAPEMRDSILEMLEGITPFSEVALSVKPLPPKDEVAEHRFLELLDALADIPTSREADVIPVGTVGDFFLEFRGEGNV
jgi:hypothetical protein